MVKSTLELKHLIDKAKMNKVPKILFVGAAQNCANYLPAVLRNIENIAACSSEVGFVFIENDSTDSTVEIIKDWGAKQENFYFINLDGLNAIPIRTLRLEIARNAYVETIKFYKKLHSFDYVAVIDMDDDGAYPIDTNMVLSGIKFLETSSTKAAIFSNQRGVYCDMWALRHFDICPIDPWEEVLDYAVKYECPDDMAFAKTFAKRIFSVEESSAPIEVESAFGGFGIYKMKYILQNQNSYLGSKLKIIPREDGTLGYHRWQVCEHVHFHAGIRNQGGEMFIYPGLINRESFDITFPANAFREMLF